MDQTCVKCGAELPDGAKFCLACGSRVVSEPGKTRFCMHCGAALPAGAKFCLQCGGAADIPAAAAPAIAVPGTANPPQEAPAPVKPEEVPAEARTADMIQYYYRRRKAIRNVVLAIPIIAYVILLFTYYEGFPDGILRIVSDIRDFLADGTIRDGYVITAVTLILTIPYWIISEAVIRNRRSNAICEAGMDGIQFKAANQKYKSMKREGELRPAADPGPIPEDMATAAAISSRYRRKSAASQTILIVAWLMFVILPALLLHGAAAETFEENARIIVGIVLLYTISHFAVVIPILRNKRKKECQNAGFEKSRFLELLYQRRIQKREIRQWAAQESARKQREEAQQAAERLAAQPAKPGRTAKIWLVFALIAMIVIGGIFLGNIFSGSSSYGAARTLDGLYIDAEGMKNLTLGVNLVYPPDIILFTSGGDVYFSQYEVVHNDAEMKQYGNHYTYKISGNTITIDGNTKYTGTINGNTISLVGKTFVPGEY